MHREWAFVLLFIVSRRVSQRTERKYQPFTFCYINLDVAALMCIWSAQHRQQFNTVFNTHLRTTTETFQVHTFFSLFFFLSFYVLPPPQSAAGILLSPKKMISFSQNWCHSCRVRVLWPLLEWQKRWDERGILLCQCTWPVVGFNFSLQYLFFFFFQTARTLWQFSCSQTFFSPQRTS